MSTNTVTIECKVAKEYELQDTASDILFKEGFLKRHPEQIKAEDLHEGVFLVSKTDRCDIASKIKTQKMLKQRNQDYRFYDSVTKEEKYVYINQNYEAFMECTDAPLGKGVFGEAFVIQNVLRGTWYCIKKLEKGKLRNNELKILKKEGMFVSSESMADQDVLIIELIQGKNLKTILEEILEDKLSFFEEARARNTNVTEVYENPFNEIFSFEQALSLNISLVEAYESLHRKGYVHGDVKPDNVMLDSVQKKCVAIDFGGTKKIGEDLRKAGSFAYAAPEVFSLNASTLKHDIYALGMVGGRILALAIDNIDLNIRQDRFNYYEKLSLDTQEATKERYNDLKEIFKSKYPEKSEINIFINIYLELFPVIFVARDTKYQEQKKLSAEAVALCRLIYQMTEPLEKRPEINAVLKEMREIRLKHIKKRMLHFVPALGNDYNNILNELYRSREKLGNATHALDNLDIFLLGSVDSNEKNRPSVVELKQYIESLDNTLMLKTKLCTEIQRCFLEKEKIKPKPQVCSRDTEVQELFLDKENTNLQFQNSLANENKPVVPQGLPLLPAQKLNEKRLRNALEEEQRKKQTLRIVPQGLPLLPARKLNEKRLRKVEIKVKDGQQKKQTLLTSWLLPH